MYVSEPQKNLKQKSPYHSHIEETRRPHKNNFFETFLPSFVNNNPATLLCKDLQPFVFH